MLFMTTDPAKNKKYNYFDGTKYHRIWVLGQGL